MSDLILTDEQRDLSGVLRHGLERFAVDDASTWSFLAQETGVESLLVPQEHGGPGGGLPEAALVMSELGYALAHDRLLPHLVATAALARLGADTDTDTAQAELLARGGVATVVGLAGSTITSLTLADGDTPALSGTCTGVLGGDEADLFVVLVGGPEAGILHLVTRDAATVSTAPEVTLDLRRPAATVRFEGAPAPRLASAQLTPWLESVAALLLAAAQWGGSRRCLDDAVAYAKVRHQFGRPIGSFQGIKHQLADVHQRVRGAETAVLRTAALMHAMDAMYGRGTRPADDLLDLTRIWCAETYVDAADTNLRVHGGIGFTTEVDCHLHVRRARSASMLLGAPHLHRRRLAARLLEQNPEPRHGAS